MYSNEEYRWFLNYACSALPIASGKSFLKCCCRRFPIRGSTGISITDVKVDRELAYADVLVSALEGSERWQEILEGLEHAQGFLRHELSQRVELRIFPTPALPLGSDF